MPFHILTGTTAPTAAPQYVGQHYINTTSRVAYESIGTSTVDDWRMCGDNSFPPMNAPDMPTSLPGSDNIGMFGSNEQWFRFVAPTAGFAYYRLLINGLTITSVWSAAFFDVTGTQVDTQAEGVTGDTATLLTVNEINFTSGGIYYIRIINHTQKFTEAGTIYYTHAN